MNVTRMDRSEDIERVSEAEDGKWTHARASEIESEVKGILDDVAAMFTADDRTLVESFRDRFEPEFAERLYETARRIESLDPCFMMSNGCGQPDFDVMRTNTSMAVFATKNSSYPNGVERQFVCDLKNYFAAFYAYYGGTMLGIGCFLREPIEHIPENELNERKTARRSCGALYFDDIVFLEAMNDE